MIDSSHRSPVATPQFADANVAVVATLLADPARAAMLWALSDGRALPAGELAHVARLAPSAASAHLAKLADSRLVVAERHGRHRYYRLVDAGVVGALEALAVIAPPTPAANLKEAYAAGAVRRARTCYDHLAGTLGVAVADSLVSRRALMLEDKHYRVTRIGCQLLGAVGVDVGAVSDAARRSRRPLARACLDWSERRYHLAGALGAAIVHTFLAAGWIERLPSTRALRVTNVGRRAFRRHFDISIV
jgi:DNA-binding transcriptional ArsR family regulator